MAGTPLASCAAIVCGPAPCDAPSGRDLDAARLLEFR
jgi:hypothetical protein